MKRWKFVLSAVLVAVLVLFPVMLTGCTEESKYPEPTKAFYVNDFANILSEATESMILSSGAALAEKTEAQVVVLTVESLEGDTIENYALSLGREWGIGNEEQDTGVLLLVALEEREVRIEVGYGLEGAITDGKAGRFLDTYAVPYFQNDDFNTGVRETYRALINEVYVEFGMEDAADEGYVPIDKLYEQQAEEEPAQNIMTLVAVIILVVLFGSLGTIGRRRGWPIFIHMGGPRGGGGGFGGFSGGGGSFGGGGSSRGF